MNTRVVAAVAALVLVVFLAFAFAVPSTPEVDETPVPCGTDVPVEEVVVPAEPVVVEPVLEPTSVPEVVETPVVE